MGVSGVERSEEHLEGAAGPRPPYYGVLVEPGMSLAQLRRHLQRLSDPAEAGCTTPPEAQRRLRRAAEAVRERVRRFNRRVPAGLKVELSPDLEALLAGAPLGEA